MKKHPDRPKQKTGKRKHSKSFGCDMTIMFIVGLLVLFGVVMIFSSSYYYTMTSAKYEYDMFHFLKKQKVLAEVRIIHWLKIRFLKVNFCLISTKRS